MRAGPLGRLRPSGFFALRTPLLPFDELLRWGEGLESTAALDQPDALQGALDSDRARLRTRLAAAFDRPELREALFLGSPDLEQAIALWSHAPGSGRGPGIERALVRYFIRMACRPTPFGLFGGCSVGLVDRHTRLEMLGLDRYQRHTRLDVQLLSSFTEAALTDGEMRSNLSYVQSSSLYRAAGTVRHVELCRTGGAASRHLVSQPQTPTLDAVLRRAANGARRADLVAEVVDVGMDAGLAARYVDRLIDDQLLVADIGVPVTGQDALASLVRQLQACCPTAEAASVLAAASNELGVLDADGLGGTPSRYREIAESLAALGAEVNLARAFHIDLVKPAPACRLGGSVIEELRRGVTLLHRLARWSEPADLDRFRKDFERRYQDREVCLLEVLDEELGIGFGSREPAAPMLEGLSFPGDGAAEPTWGPLETVMLRKIMDLPAGSTEVVLDQCDIDEMAGPESSNPPLPGALSVFATVAASSGEAIDRGNFQVLFGAAGGPSGAWMLGRFCSADPDLRHHVEAHLAEEELQDPDAVWAEIVHMPVDKFANVVLRPVLRGYEISYLGRSGAPSDRQLPMSDLFVSVLDGEIVLRSKRLSRRVIPRLTAAHNFRIRSLPGYRFLCALPLADGITGLAWDWGALGGAPFLPRISVGRLVLARARWRLGPDELNMLGRLSADDLFQGVASWRARRRLPTMVSLVDGEGHDLAIDFTNILSVETFVDQVGSRDEAVVEEMFPGPDQLCASGPEGTFVSELVVPFVVDPEGAGAPADPPEGAGSAPPGEMVPVGQDDAVIRRSFPPGSEWLYAKVYAPPSVIDEILRDVVLPVQARSVALGTTDRWHFVRYGDPDGHLRVRFHGPPVPLHEFVLPALRAGLDPFMADRRVWRFQLDTYEREVGRYGGPHGSLVAEQIFSIDSDTVVELLGRMTPGDQGADERWRVAVVATDMLFDDLGVGDAGKRSILRRGRDFFAWEMRLDGHMEGLLSQRFRTERSTLEAWCSSARADVAQVPALLQPLVDRSRRLAPLVAELRDLESAGRLQDTVDGLAMSYVHMGLNRLLRWEHRRQELVVYDFLGRLHQSRTARSAPKS